MNRAFTLPAAFALTMHAFVLFGLTGKDPVPAASPEAAPPIEPPPRRDYVELAPVPAGDEDDDGPATGGEVRRLVDVPPVGPVGDRFTITPHPPATGSGPIRKIPIGWEMPGTRLGGVNPGVVELYSLDHVPRARVQPAPDYPHDLRSRGVEATVLVEFLVDENGNVYHAVVLRATAPGFDDAVLRAVERWKFEPGLKNHRRVRFRMSVPVVFSIRGN